MEGERDIGRKGQQYLIKRLIIVAVVAAFAALIGYAVYSSSSSISSEQEGQVERALQGVDIQLVKNRCKSEGANHCSGDLPPQCPEDALDEGQLWSCRTKTGRGTQQNPFYCYEVWASGAGGGIQGIPACSSLESSDGDGAGPHYIEYRERNDWVSHLRFKYFPEEKEWLFSCPPVRDQSNDQYACKDTYIHLDHPDTEHMGDTFPAIRDELINKGLHEGIDFLVEVANNERDMGWAEQSDDFLIVYDGEVRRKMSPDGDIDKEQVKEYVLN